MWSSDNTGLAVLSERSFKFMDTYTSVDLILAEIMCPKDQEVQFRQLLIKLVSDYGCPRVGTSRVAFATNSGSIIKVALSKRGLSQNISECSLSGKSLTEVLTDSYGFSKLQASDVTQKVSPLPTVVDTRYRDDLIEHYDLAPNSVIEQEQVDVIENIYCDDSKVNFDFWNRVDTVLDGVQIGRSKNGLLKFYDY